MVRRFYTGSSSSGELDSAKEESYRLAHALGVSSDADRACGFNFCDVGLLSPDNAASSKFTKYCSRFRVPEVERDLLAVEDTKLVEASEYLMISLSHYSLVSLFRMYYHFALWLNALLRGLSLSCWGTLFASKAGYIANRLRRRTWRKLAALWS